MVSSLEHYSRYSIILISVACITVKQLCMHQVAAGAW
jgi:hypothetical protein